jgi:hypothetical protein
MPYEAVSFPIGGRDVYRGLIVQYSLIALYAAGASIFGAQTVGLATGPLYAAIFPVALFGCALAALWGVVRSRYTRKVAFEYAGTALMLAGLVGFSVSIIWVGFDLDEHWRFPGALLPIAMCVFPFLRMRNIIKVVRSRRAPIPAAVELEPEGD